MLKQVSGYLGNSLLKRKNTQHQFTQEQVQEYVKCANDPIYFILNYVKIVHVDRGLVPFELYDFQKDLINSLHDNRFSIVKTARQCGKSTVSIAYLLHYILFNDNKTVGILANKAATSRELLGRLQLAYEKLPNWLQQGVTSWNKGDIELENGSKIIAAATSGSAVRGMSFSCVTADTKITICDDYGRIFYDDIVNADSSKYKYNKEYIDRESKMKYKHNFVYKTINQVNGKEYIGVHCTNDIDDGYLGSGKILKKAIEKYGVDNFKREIIENFDTREEAFDLEYKLVDKEYTLRDDTYNLVLGGNINPISYGKNNPFYGRSHSEDTKTKISKANKNRKWTEKERNNRPDMSTIEKTTRKSLTIDGIYYRSVSHCYRETGLTDMELKRILLKDGNGFTDHHLQSKHKEDMAKYDQYLAESKIISNRRKSESAKGQHHHWQDKINKNPEKIRKTAEKHRGMKRSPEACENMRLAANPSYGKDNGNFKGYWITPEGKFDSLSKANDAIDYIKSTAIYGYCKNSDKKITNHHQSLIKEFGHEIIGKTFNDIGFGFQDA